jgi:hypothetical protein
MDGRKADCPDELFRCIQFGQLLAKVFHFGQIVVDDVSIVRVMYGVVLMVRLCFVVSIERGNLRDDGTGEGFGFV